MPISRSQFWKILILFGVVLLNVFVFSYFYFHNSVARNGGLFSMWAIENTNEVNPRWFVFDASKNQYTGKVMVKNFSMKILDLDVYTADYHPTEEGSFGIETQSDERDTIGKWVSSEQTSLRLLPAQQKEVFFVLDIPEGLDTHESYAGGIAVEWKGDNDGAVQLNTRMVVPIFIQFRGVQNTFLQSSLEHAGLLPVKANNELQASDFSPQFAIQALSPEDSMYESWFDFHGAQKGYEGKVLLKNLSQTDPVKIHLTTAEYDKNAKGTYILRDDSAITTNLGKWIRFDQTDYDLEAGKTQEVSFRITIPSDINQDESFAASILAEQMIPSSDPNVPNLKVRLGVRTFYRYGQEENVILGEMREELKK